MASLITALKGSYSDGIYTVQGFHLSNNPITNKFYLLKNVSCDLWTPVEEGTEDSDPIQENRVYNFTSRDFQKFTPNTPIETPDTIMND